MNTKTITKSRVTANSKTNQMSEEEFSAILEEAREDIKNGNVFRFQGSLLDIDLRNI
jgi:hypothetical protein